MSGGEFAGRLGERVTLYRAVPERDALGGWTGGWTTIGSAWAVVAPEGVGAGRWRVTLRPRMLLAGDRVGWGAETLVVRRAWIDPATPDRMTAMTEEVR